MKDKNLLRDEDHNQEPASAARPTATGDLKRDTIDFAPSPVEPGGKNDSSYVNQSSLPGDTVQQWLDSERQLLAEHNLAQVHGLRHRL
jgi:hypothetical protein